MRWKRTDPMTAHAMLVAGLMIAQMTEAKAVRDSVFLTYFPVTALPYMTLSAAVFAILASFLGSRIMRATTPDRVAPLAFLISGGMQIGERGLLLVNPHVAAVVIYLHVFAINLMLTSSFWSLMNEHYDPRSARKSFGKIAGMGTFGGIFGGLIAERVAALGSVAALILVTATLHLACGVSLWWFTRRHKVIRLAEKKVSEDYRGVGQVLKKSPYLLEVAALMISVSAAAGLVDYLFKTQVSLSIPKGPELTRFFALFYTITAVLGVGMQTFVASPALSRLGLAATAGLLPLSVLAGAGWVMAFRGLAQLTIFRGLEVVLRSSLFRSGYELFYTPVPAEEKRAVKAIIDVNGERFGDVLASGIISLLLIFGLAGTGSILAIVTAFSVAGLVLARRLGRSYTSALEKSLKKQSNELEDLSQFENPESGIFVREELREPAIDPAPEKRTQPRDPVLAELRELRSDEESRVVRALMGIGKPHPALIHQLIQMLSNDVYAFLAMDKLSGVASLHVGQLSDALNNRDEPFAIRRRIPLILARSGSQRAVDNLLAALSDDQFLIRFRSAHAVYQLRMEHPKLQLHLDRVWMVLDQELEVNSQVWEQIRLAVTDDGAEDASQSSLEYLFVLLGLVLPHESVRMTYRALQTEDKHLRGTALEYLQTVLPAGTWKPLENLIADRTIAKRVTKTPTADTKAGR